MEKIEKENKLTELLKIENTKELYDFLHENGYSKSENEFKAEIEKLVEETAIDLEDSELGAVAGGTTKNKLTKLTSVGMASLLALGASPISPKAHASDVYYFSDYQAAAMQKSAKNNSSSAKKIILAALGIGGAGTVIGVGGLGAYMLYKHHKSKSNPQDVNPPPTADIKMSIEDEATPPEESTQEITDTPQETIDPPEQSYVGIENDEPAPESPKDDDVGSSNPERTQEEPEQPEINEYFQRQSKEEEERRQREEEQARVEAERRAQEERRDKIFQLRSLIYSLITGTGSSLSKTCELSENKFSLPLTQVKVLLQANKLKAQNQSLNTLRQKIDRLENDTSESLDEVQNECDQLNTQHTIAEMRIKVLPLLDQSSFGDIVGEANSLLDEMDKFETNINSLNPEEKNSKVAAFKQQVESLLERYEEEKVDCCSRYTELRTNIIKLKGNIEKLNRRPSITQAETDEIYELESRCRKLSIETKQPSFEDAAKNPFFKLGDLEKDFENLQTEYNTIKEKLDSKMKRQFGECCKLTSENEALVLKITNTISEKLENDLRNLVGVDIKEFQQSNDTDKEKTVQSSSRSDVINSVRTYFNYMCCAINNYVWPEGSDGHNLLNQKIATDDVPSMLNRLIVSCGLAPNLDQNKLKNVQECIRTIKAKYMQSNCNRGISLFGYEIVDLLRDTGIINSIDFKELIKCNKFRAISEFLIALKRENLIHNYQNIKLENGDREYTLEQLLQTPSLVSGKFIVNINDEDKTQMYINIDDSSGTLSSLITRNQRKTLEQVYGEIDWFRYRIDQNDTELLCGAINRAKELNLNINSPFDYSDPRNPGNSLIKELWKQNISNSENIIDSAEDECDLINIILIKILVDKMNGDSEVDKETSILNIIHMLSPICGFVHYCNKGLLEASRRLNFKISREWLMKQCAGPNGHDKEAVKYAEYLLSKLGELGIHLPKTSE